jgi:hypothetical protein
MREACTPQRDGAHGVARQLRVDGAREKMWEYRRVRRAREMGGSIWTWVLRPPQGAPDQRGSGSAYPLFMNQFEARGARGLSAQLADGGSDSVEVCLCSFPAAAGQALMTGCAARSFAACATVRSSDRSHVLELHTGEARGPDRAHAGMGSRPRAMAAAVSARGIPRVCGCVEARDSWQGRERGYGACSVPGVAAGGA